MSGNVSQMVNLLEMCLISRSYDFKSGMVLKSTIDAVYAVHKVYMGMQVCIVTIIAHRSAAVTPRTLDNLVLRDHFKIVSVFVGIHP